MSRSWLRRAWATIFILWEIWVAALAWSGAHRKRVLCVGRELCTHPLDYPLPVREFLGRAAIGTVVALFFAFLAWLWLRPAERRASH